MANQEKSDGRRGPWGKDEDKELLRLVHEKGPQNWVNIAAQLGTRTPKQCRERYHQNLKETLDHSPITEEEGRLIESLVAQMGKHWAEIARHLPGRSDNAVKNWWNGGMNRRKRMGERRESSYRSGTNLTDKARQAAVRAEEERRAQEVADRRARKANRRSVERAMGSPVTLAPPQQQYPQMQQLPQLHRQLPSLMTSPSATYPNPYEYATRTLPQPLIIPGHRARIEHPLVSPEIGNPPSLVDDNGSLYTPSPRLAHPLALQSPTFHREESRGNYFRISPVEYNSPLGDRLSLDHPEPDLSTHRNATRNSLCSLAEVAAHYNAVGGVAPLDRPRRISQDRPREMTSQYDAVSRIAPLDRPRQSADHSYHVRDVRRTEQRDHHQHLKQRHNARRSYDRPQVNAQPAIQTSQNSMQAVANFLWPEHQTAEATCTRRVAQLALTVDTSVAGALNVAPAGPPSAKSSPSNKMSLTSLMN